MVSQTRFLSRNLETDIGGNHLLENIRALGMAGAFFMGNESDLWLRQADRLLRRELPRQFLPHGEHFERSPMYHAHMLEVLLDLRDVTHQRAPDISKLCNEYSVRAAEFLATILHTDGEIPLFADSVLCDAPPSQVLLARADCGVDHIIPDVRADGGYWTFRDKDLFVVFDAAPAGVDHLPAHSHADLLTFELSYCGRRLFVDTGVHDYADSDMRRYCRGTAAHNVVQIDDLDQFDMWSRFRVGYRGWPAKLSHAEENGFWWAYATHNAYRRAKVPIIGRWVACGRGFVWTCVDWALGDGKHQLATRLHLHPDAKANVCGDTTVRISLSGVVPLYLHCLSVGHVNLAKSWYCPHFGQRQKTTAIEVVVTETLPVAMGWYLSAAESCPAKLSMTEAGWRFSIEDASPIRSWAYDMNQQIVRAD
jgi:uncharacterized heparinase superfamily protein